MKGRAKVVCTWCGKVLGTTKGTRTSHGICPECKAQIMKEYKKK